MTKKEAIEIIDPKTRDDALSEYDCRMRVLAKKEAARLAVSALRAQQTPAKLDRSRWEGCPYCKDARNDHVPYCQYCGRPQTEEAWAELERRIKGGTTDNTD